MKKTVLIVDDSAYIRKTIADILSQREDLEIVDSVGSGETAIDRAIELKPDLITLDNILPDMHGLDILRTVKDHIPGTKVIMISAVGQESVIHEATESGASQYIVKPFTEDALLGALSQVLD
ncbi:MAG: response regulator [Bacteroidota bacterium]